MLNPDYSDMLSAFAAEGVEYLLIGAYAMAVHGEPRATGDMDLWVCPSEENAARVMNALTRFGAPLSQVSAADFEEENVVFQIGLAPRRIDLLTSVEGVTFDEAWPERLAIELAGTEVSVISRHHLIQNKRALGRAQDRADVERLEGNSPDASSA